LDHFHYFPTFSDLVWNGEERIYIINSQVLFSVHRTIICFRRFFYKKPEVLKDQAKVYSMKVSEKPEIKPEVRHLPMRLEAARLPHVEDSGELGS